MIMSNTSNVLVVRQAEALSARSGLRAFADHAGDVLRRLWRGYWDYQARRATAMLLHMLDERALADIGFKRSEIESAVFGSPSDRLRRYDPKWRLQGKV
jgi:uncharacterized protein YjiS (DUF1127 family)